MHYSTHHATRYLLSAAVPAASNSFTIMLLLSHHVSWCRITAWMIHLENNSAKAHYHICARWQNDTLSNFHFMNDHSFADHLQLCSRPRQHLSE